MMVKGFIFFRDGKIPFVIENYRMELFTDDSLLDDFCKEYNFKENYILHGQCFDIGIRGRKATFLVENSIGSTCYLRCYTINLFYVCCSRPKKRLIFFVTVPIDSTFKSFLVELVGEQNIFTFSQYIERKSIK